MTVVAMCVVVTVAATGDGYFDTVVARNGDFTTVEATTGVFTDLIGIPAGLTDGDSDALGDLSCASDEIAKWNGTAWGCQADVNTQLSETQVDAFANDNGYALSAALSTVADTGQFTDLLGIPAGLADGDSDALGDMTCADDEIAKYNSGLASWECKVDVDTNTQRDAGAGLALSGNTLLLSDTGCVANEVLKRNDTNNGWECVADIDTNTRQAIATENLNRLLEMESG